MQFNIDYIRSLFPITSQKFPIAGSSDPAQLIYLDHGASTHAPVPVFEEYSEFLQQSYGNVHRGQHHLSMISTEMFEDVYAEVMRFIRAESDGNCVVLTGNTTGALDLAAHVMEHVEGATIISGLEHHSNDLPHRRRGTVLRTNTLADGTIDYDDMERLLKTNKVKLVAVTGASNVTGLLTDIPRVARMAHAHGAKLLVDAAQLLAHKQIDVRPNNDPEHIDFLAAAGHKAYAPFGTAFLFGPREVLDAAPPYLAGGGTVVFVTATDVLFTTSPDRHQGGTPNIGGAVALGAALRFLSSIGMDAIREHERALTVMALAGLTQIEGVRILGTPDPEKRLGVVTFTIDGIPHAEVASMLNREAAIAVRNGCFCAHPYLHQLLGLKDAEVADLTMKLRDGRGGDIPGAVRATFGIYNTESEVERLVEMIKIIIGKCCQ